MGKVKIDDVPIDSGSAERWRRLVLERVFFHMFLLVGFICLNVSLEACWSGNWVLVFPLGAATALQAVAAFARPLEVKARAGAFTAAAAVGLGAGLPAVGLGLPNPLVVASITLVLLGLCVGRRFALVGLGIITFVVILDGYLVTFVQQGPLPAAVDTKDFGRWLHVALVFSVTGLLAITSVDFLVRRLERAMTRNAALFAGLKQESQERIAALKAKQQVEEAAQRSHELQLLGLLAANVAHDFNNLLTVILGNAELAKRKTKGAQENLVQVEQAAQNAADLCRRLLTLGGETVEERQTLDLGQIVEEELPLLSTVVGTQVRLDWLRGPSVYVTCSRMDIRQILLNLCANARDAMPDGGRITIRVENVHWKPKGGDDMADYARLVLEDTGTGMDEETQARLFEPFFTTKGKRGGTGLGMAIIQTAVSQQGGFLEVESELGLGTRVSLHFPATETRSEVSQKNSVLPQSSLQGSETILLVDDDDGVRRLLEEYLESHGYHVHGASDGDEGLRTFLSHRSEIDLVVSDAVMPALGGVALSEKILEKAPDMPFLFCSGFVSSTLSLSECSSGRRRLLAKPFTERVFLERVRQLLDHTLDERERS